MNMLVSILMLVSKWKNTWFDMYNTFSFCKYRFRSLDVWSSYSWSLYVNSYSHPVMNMRIHWIYPMDDSKLWKTVFHAEHGRYQLNMYSCLFPVLPCGNFSWKTKIHPWWHASGRNCVLCFLEASLATSEIIVCQRRHAPSMALLGTVPKLTHNWSVKVTNEHKLDYTTYLYYNYVCDHRNRA